MQAIIRVDASETIGLGHLMRCLALAQGFQRAECDVIFLVNDGAVDIARHRHDWVGRIVSVPVGISQLHEADWIAEFAEQHLADILVIDGYHFEQKYRQMLSRVCACAVCFDDNNTLSRLHADVVINGAQNASELDYATTAPEATLCLGTHYRVLRDEFVINDPLPLTERHNLTLTMGGSDPKHLTLPVLEALDRAGFDGQVRVITGAAYTRLAELELFIKHSPVAVQHVHDCQYMADMFNHARLTVSAAGGSQFELLCCHSPSVLLVVADNQHNATLQSQRQGWCEYADCREQVDTFAIVDLILDLWRDEERLSSMHRAAQHFADTAGTDRAVNAILEHIQDAR